MVNPMDLTGRTVLVTGASSGIGRETSILLSRLGARVILVARDRDRLAETESQLEGKGHRIELLDLTLVEELPNWLKGLAAETGALDGLVHGAGIQITRPLRFLSSEDLELTMRINLHSAVALAKAFRQKPVRQKLASIVFVSSVMGLVGQAGQAAYVASKGALVSLTRALALELARESIRVNSVAPAVVRTEMTERLRKALTPQQFAEIEAMHPLGLGTPLDVAYSIAFLLADTSRWITGTTLVVDGGYTAQ